MSVSPVYFRHTLFQGPSYPLLDWPIDNNSAHASVTPQTLQEAVCGPKRWKWPKQPVFFISDPHADAQAFEASLQATGGVEFQYKKGKRILKLTKQGKRAVFVIGGDCLDKGPSNLALLRSVQQLMQSGARVKLIAGNHDLRLLMGILSVGKKRDAGSEHMFVRMGSKVVPLLEEVFTTYLAGTHWDKNIPSEERCRELLFPSDVWFENFPRLAAGKVTPEGIERELKKMRHKVSTFEGHCAKRGLDMRRVYAVALKCRELFIKRKGEFSWFFHDMQLAYRKGSCLFVHAGLDDTVAESIAKRGIKHLNRQFRKQLKSSLFDFYYSSLANTFRTKYRLADNPLTPVGVAAIKAAGIQLLVRGHVNQLAGQSLSIRQGLLHLEGDITLDRHSRKKEGLPGMGYGATLIHPAGLVVGISADFPCAKVLEPARYQHNLTGVAHAA